jgi:hypothetical protein
VVIIRGRLRAGKVVTKKHIGFVWEGAASPKTDALVQGLPGRMCGYDFGGSDERPIIFVSPAANQEKKGKVVRSSEMGRAILEYPTAIPTKATNLKKPHIANEARRDDGSLRIMCPPLAISYDLTNAGYEALSTHRSSNADLRAACHTLFHEKAAFLRAEVARSNVYTDKQKAEIQSYITRGDPPNFRRYRPVKYEEIMKAYKNKTVPSEAISDFPDVTFFTYDSSYSHIPGAASNRVYIIFYTDAKPKLNLASVHLESRIPRTNGRSVFTPHARNFDVPIVAGGVAGFREDACLTPIGFEMALHEYLTAWRSSEALSFARCIQSTKGRFTFSKEVFCDTNDVRRIIARVGSAFGVELKPKIALGCVGSGSHIIVKEITW